MVRRLVGETGAGEEGTTDEARGRGRFRLHPQQRGWRVSTVVTVMDRDGFDNCTDNIVVVQPGRHRLLWVPRDVWCEPRAERINASFKRGSHQRLVEDLQQLGIEVDHSVCLSRSTVERALASIDVTVPVHQPLQFWYPMSPTERIQEGRKPVDFMPPNGVGKWRTFSELSQIMPASSASATSPPMDRGPARQGPIHAGERPGPYRSAAGSGPTTAS